MIHNHIVYSEYSNYRFTVTKAQGSYIWDEDGHKLLDFTSGWNVANLGWNHPEVNEAFIRQAEKSSYVPMWTADPVQMEYATALTEAYPGMDTAIRVTGGTEANEVAVKLARAATGRTKIIGFKDTYHGQLFAAMALGFRPEYVRAIDPLVPDFIQLDYPAANGDETADAQVLKTFEATLDSALSGKDVAAMFVEPGIITGWGSCFVAPAGFLDVVRNLTKKYGTLMVVDEVGTGFSRIGKLFGVQISEVLPDIVTLAKGITNGAGGLGAVLSRAELVEPTIPKANYTSTFGWMPTACAAGLAVLAIHQRDAVWENAEAMGRKLRADLSAALSPLGATVRGLGLESCLDLNGAAEDPVKLVANTLETAQKNGLHLTPAEDGLFQLMPPCNISEEDLQTGVSILIDSVKSNL